jgi:16S rRNA G966 N2-methylase RsmD
MQVLSEKFDVVYIDPPYRENLYNPALDSIFKNNILAESAIIVVEHPQDEEIDFSNFEILKQKKYSDKIITFLKTIY